MDYRVDGQAAYVLHSRPYRDTSLLVDFFTLEYGKVSAVVNGARRPNSRLRPVLQPFVPLHISWRGRQELKTLNQAEPVAAALFLKGNSLMCGLYVNELLERTLQPFDEHPRLYVFYQYVLNELLTGQDVEGALRTFEHHLLDELGYAQALADTDDAGIYQWNAGSGFRMLTAAPVEGRMRCFYGRHLQAIARDDYSEDSTRRAAKRLMRLLLEQLLGDKPLRSRELFQKM